MRVSDLIRRSAVAVRAEQTVVDAASIMDRAGVGALVVVEGDRPVGIVTDRDLMRRALARALPPDARVDGVMSAPLITVDAADDAHDVFAVLRRHPIRRLPVTSSGRLVGMVTVDDLLVHMAADLSDLVRPVTAELLFAQHDAAVPVTT